MKLKYPFAFFLLVSPMLCLHWICSEIGCSENSVVYRNSEYIFGYLHPNDKTKVLANKTLTSATDEAELFCANLCAEKECHYFVLDVDGGRDVTCAVFICVYLC